MVVSGVQSMDANRLMFIGAVLWGLAFILSAIVLRKSYLGDWVEGSLLVVWIIYLSYWAAKVGRNKNSDKDK
jgi:hypothetical protein